MPDIEVLRVEAVRELCTNTNFGRPTDSAAWLAWLAQSVLNILNGNIDDQLLDPEVAGPYPRLAIAYLRKATEAVYADNGPTPVLVEIRNALAVLGAYDVGPFVP